MVRTMLESLIADKSSAKRTLRKESLKLIDYDQIDLLSLTYNTRQFEF